MVTKRTISTSWVLTAKNRVNAAVYGKRELNHDAVHRALLIVKKIPTPETGNGRFFLGGHTQLWGP